MNVVIQNVVVKTQQGEVRGYAQAEVKGSIIDRFLQ
jgi:hypothetical protein